MISNTELARRVGRMRMEDVWEEGSGKEVGVGKERELGMERKGGGRGKGKNVSEGYKDKNTRKSGTPRLIDSFFKLTAILPLSLNLIYIFHPHPKVLSTSYSLSLPFPFFDGERGFVNNHGMLIDSFF